MSAFADYLAAIKKELARGDATENTYRPTLKTLLEASAKGITATNEPKHIPLIGAPDFKVSRGKIPLGHIETKDIGTDLAEMERGKGANGEQFLRYATLPNWILTDYLEFRWYTHGERRRVVRVAELTCQNKIKPIPTGEQKLADLLTSFIQCSALTVGTAKELANSMAGYTRTMQQQTIAALQQKLDDGWLHQWLEAFREVLIPDLDEKQFSDMFAQTLAYGLFAARVHTPEKEQFSRDSAARAIPKTNPFLQQLFYEITGPKLPDSIAWVMEDIVALLNHADMHEILKNFGKGKGKEDPVVHFYETFLAAYDPKMRQVRGVYYTPEPVVSYIVRSIDHLLKTRFNRPKGLADENTLILDPATGTATFLYFVIDQIYQTFAKQAGAWDGYVAKHLLNRIFGFELLMAPYAVAHLKLGMQLQKTGYQFGSDQRLGIYLTNTLEEAAKKTDQLFAGWIADEANAAAKIKRDDPILVVLGNPPYSNFGQMNRGQWILSLLDDYKRDLHEKKINIDDDFIKFVRFAQWRIEKTGYGVIGFITNNTYLDGLTHRRMRESLLNTFNEIYVLNLHGSAKKKEAAPDGSKDENVFDITVGVAISLFVKLPNAKGCRVFHADLWGEREAKYKALWETGAATTQWVEVKPAQPHFFFVPKEWAGSADYSGYQNLAEMFGVFGNGIGTDRDSLVYDSDKEALLKRMEVFYTPEALEPPFRDTYRVENSSSYKLLSRRQRTKFSEVAVRTCLYRPFDMRWLYYDPELISRPGFDVMRHLLKKNLAMLVTRQVATDAFHHVFVSASLVDRDPLSLVTRERTQAFPLYLSDTEKKKGRDWSKAVTMALFEASADYETRRPNLSPAFLKALAEKLKLPQTQPYGLPKGITPEDIFHYAYAVFHSPTYRTRYAEFLKIDFPRLPLTSNLKLFRALAAKGAELVALHLMESAKLNNFITTFPLKGDNVVEKVQYIDKDKRVWINPTQYFGGVPKPVWGFHIGGYQVCDKWLKDRKGRKLSYDDKQHYQKIVAALCETIRLMSEIDALIPCWPLE